MAKQWIEGRLGYNAENDRYGLLVSDLWECDGFHCGERLQIWVEDEWIDTSMEMDWFAGKGVWYLTETSLKGGMLEGVRVRILKNV